jgi:tRNA (Thr-GGU) A37 N-methylase
MSLELVPIGRVESPLLERAQAPRQGDEGAPPAWIVFERTVHPRGDPSRPVEGVFSTRSPDRPNPIGLHRVRIVAIEGARMQVAHLEALDGTPILDVKPVLGAVEER